MILYLNDTQPKLQLNMSLQCRARYKYHKSRETKKKFNAFIMLFWMLIYIVSKDENMHHFGSHLFFIQLGRSVLVFTLAKNWEQGTMFYPMYPKGHFYVLSSFTHKLGQFLKLMPHYKIAPHWFSIFHICFEFARFGIG
jgi:hypothetical protein